MLRTSLWRAGAARSATERPTRRSKRTTRAPPTRMVRSRCRAVAAKMLQNGGWLTAWKRLQRPYLASRRALRAFKRNAANRVKANQNGFIGPWRPGFGSITQPQLVQHCATRALRITAVTLRQSCSANWPTSSDSHLLSKGCALPGEQPIPSIPLGINFQLS